AMLSRVTPGSSSTSARRAPAYRLKSVDLPTLGRPTIATIGSGDGGIAIPWAREPRVTRSLAWSPGAAPRGRAAGAASLDTGPGPPLGSACPPPGRRAGPRRRARDGGALVAWPRPRTGALAALAFGLAAAPPAGASPETLKRSVSNIL